MKSRPSKGDHLREAFYASGGVGKMFKEQAAGPAKPGRTGKTQTTAPGKRAAAGGPPTTGHTVSHPAKPGRTGAVMGQKKGR